MKIKSLIADQKNFLNQFQDTTGESKITWERALDSIKVELQREVTIHISTERTKAAKIAELSRIKMIS